jgi:hypothetical protein
MNILWLCVGIGLIALGLAGLYVGLSHLRRERPVRAIQSSHPRGSGVTDAPARLDGRREDQPVEAADYEFHTFVMGQRDTNPDGTHRQDIIATLAPGDSLTLRHEATATDQGSLAVVAAGGVIGFLPSREVGELARNANNWTNARVTIDRIFDDEVNQSRVLGVWMHIELWGIDQSPSGEGNADDDPTEKEEVGIDSNVGVIDDEVVDAARIDRRE